MLIIRDAQTTDAEQIAQIQIGSFRSAYAGILPDDYLAQFDLAEQTQDWRNWMTEHPQDILLVAEEDGTLRGYALSRPQGDLPGYAAELIALHVRREFHRKGLGLALVRAAALRLEQAGCASLMLWVMGRNPSRGFYEHLGGTLLTARSIELDDEGTTAEEVAYGWADIRVLSAQSPL